MKAVAVAICTEDGEIFLYSIKFNDAQEVLDYLLLKHTDPELENPDPSEWHQVIVDGDDEYNVHALLTECMEALA